jgi:hypothetical protein
MVAGGGDMATTGEAGALTPYVAEFEVMGEPVRLEVYPTADESALPVEYWGRTFGSACGRARCAIIAGSAGPAPGPGRCLESAAMSTAV